MYGISEAYCNQFNSLLGLSNWKWPPSGCEMDLDRALSLPVWSLIICEASHLPSLAPVYKLADKLQLLLLFLLSLAQWCNFESSACFPLSFLTLDSSRSNDSIGLTRDQGAKFNIG